MKEATTWPNAAIAIAGAGLVTALGAIVIWQVFSTLRTYLASWNGIKLRKSAAPQAQGENA